MLSAFLENPIVTILICIASFSIIVKVVKVVFKIAMAGIIVFLCFLTIRLLVTTEITPLDPSSTALEKEKESKREMDDTLYISNNSDARINQSPRENRLQELQERETDLVVRHHHYHYLLEGRNLNSSNKLEQDYPSNLFGLESEGGERLDLDDTILVQSINCEQVIADNRYIIAVSFNTNESYAAAYVEKLREAGFRSARYIWLPCYKTDRAEEMFIVTIDRACRSINSIESKLKKNIKKAKANNIVFPTKVIIHILKNTTSVTQSNGWVNQMGTERDLAII